jgi:hypothetical protein
LTRWRQSETLKNGEGLTVARAIEISGDVIAVSSDEEMDPRPDARAKPMRLQGAEALQLYIIEIEKNLAVLAAHIAMLQAELAERRKFLCLLTSSSPEPDQPSRPMH